MTRLTNEAAYKGRQNGTIPGDTAVLLGRVYPTAGHKGDLRVEIRPEDPAALMKPDHLPRTLRNRQSLLKTAWHDMMKQPGQLGKLLHQRGVPENEIAGEVAKTQHLFACHFRSVAPATVRSTRRLFGMGTHVRLELADGSFDAIVKRNPPAGGDKSGVVLESNRYACAGGMADDDLSTAQIRELNEEAIMLIDRGDHFECAALTPQRRHGNLTPGSEGERSILNDRLHRFTDAVADQKLANHPAIREVRAGKPVRHTIRDLSILQVPEHQHNFAYTMPDGKSASLPAIIVDDPVNGNLNVVSIGMLHLPDVKSSQIQIIDDEMRNPRRQWSLWRPKDLSAAAQRKDVVLASYVEQVTHDSAAVDRAVRRALLAPAA